jgi:hypothetical protein
MDAAGQYKYYNICGAQNKYPLTRGVTRKEQQMLEEELGKIWSNTRIIQSSFRPVTIADQITAIQLWNGALAHNDYNYWKSKDTTCHGSARLAGARKEYEYRICEATATLIEQHLIEALSSPYHKRVGKACCSARPFLKGELSTAEGCLVGGRR